MSEPFLGQLGLFPYSFAPSNWMDCAGQLLPIQQYSALFSLLGVAYGGNGTTNFALPNLQGRVAVGYGNGTGLSPYEIGEATGSGTVTVLQTEMPAHTHPLNATQDQGTTNIPNNDDYLANVVVPGEIGQPQAQGNVYAPPPATTTMGPASINPAGGNQAHNNMQPYLALRYCISLSGVYPSRP